MESIKKNLREAIKEYGQFFVLNEPLNDELIYQIIFDTYFKDLTDEDIKEIVEIKPPKNYPVECREKTAYVNLKLTIDFYISERSEKLNYFTESKH